MDRPAAMAEHDSAGLGALTDAHNARLAKLDPLVGPLVPPHLDDATVLRVPLEEGELVGVWKRLVTPAEQPFALWCPPIRDVLTVRSDRPLEASQFGDLLDRWRSARSARPAESVGVVRLATAESGAVAGALLRRGFAPMRITAARLVDDDGPEPAAPAGIVIRPPRPADRESVLDLMMELHAADAQWGVAQPLDDARDRYAHYVDEALAHHDWAWVAERDGDVVAALTLTPPEASEWIAPSTSLTPVVYLGLASVTATLRSRGVGTALTGRALDRARAAGAQVVLLDHAALSPSSSTFWHRMGFRPLFTEWCQTTE